MIGKNIALIKEIPTQRGFFIDAAAKYLGMSKSTLRRRANAGEIASYHDHGHRCFHLEDLNAYLEKQDDHKVYPKKIPRNDRPDKA